MVIWEKDKFEQVNSDIASIKAEIESLLEKQDEESFRQVCEMVETDEYSRFSGLDRELFILERMGTIQRQEMAQGEEETVFKNRNIAQIGELYQVLIFYLRRLEFDLSLEEQRGLVEYMQEEHLSAICVWGVIQMAQYIYNKEKTLTNFLDLVEMM